MHADLPVRVTPKSSRNEIVLETDNSLRAWVTASPTDNQANEAVCELLASKLGISRSRVFLLKGHGSRQKLVRVDGLGLDRCLEILNAL